jgi:hypothetical protein
MKKYDFTDETLTLSDGTVLHRIKAIIDFGSIKKGSIGGFIEDEHNLYHTGNAWIYNNAKVYGSAEVFGNAKVSGNAKVYGSAEVFGNAEVSGNAKVYGNSLIYGYAEVYGNAKVYGNAVINNEVNIYGNSNCISNINDDIEETIRVQTGLIPINGEVIAYKQVNKNLSSFYDPSFVYKIGEYVSVDCPDESNKSCASGLHFSNATYWNNAEGIENSTFLIAKIKVEDIITVQGGKIRCRRAFILGKYDIK